MLMPKRTKYRRVQRGRMKGAASRGNKVSYGEFGIQALEPGWITGNQIEAARVAMTRYTKRGGQVWIKIFPDKPVSKKALGVRMGSGKGAPEYWVAVVKNQKVMFEIGGVSEAEAREALRLAQHKLPSRRRSLPRKPRKPRMVVNKMKANEIRKLSAAELDSKLADLKKDLFMLRMQHATNQLDNPLRIAAVKKDIARIKTIIRENETK